MYGGPRPEFAWVKIINCDGEDEKIKVEILYSTLPYSCSICKAFGHSLSRCLNNPDAVRPQSRKSRTTGVNAKSDGNANVTKENYVNNMEMVPYVIGSLAGCAVVMDEDDILNQAKEAMNNDEDYDDGEHNDIQSGDQHSENRNPKEKNETQSGEQQNQLVNLESNNAFGILSALEEGEVDALVSPSPTPRKIKNGKSPKGQLQMETPNPHLVVLGPAATGPGKLSVVLNCGENKGNKITPKMQPKRSLRLTGKPVNHLRH